MDTSLAPIDVAQHFPFLDRNLIRTPPAVRRALWLVAVGQITTEGEPCPVRARFLSGDVEHPDCPEWLPSPGGAGRVSVVLNQLEERGVLVGYRGRGRRPHLWSFRPELQRWQGFHWEVPVGNLSEVVTGCFCRAASDLVARFPGHRLVQVRRRAKFELLPRDHITPPGLFLVENGDNLKSRATRSRRPGANPVDTRDNAGPAPTVSLLSENSENSPVSEEEENRYARLVHFLEDKCPDADYVVPGREPDTILRRLARDLDDAGCRAVCKHFDLATAGGPTQRVPSGARLMERMAQQYLPKVTAAL
jgi:hypothetical protein